MRFARAAAQPAPHVVRGRPCTFTCGSCRLLGSARPGGPRGELPASSDGTAGRLSAWSGGQLYGDNSSWALRALMQRGVTVPLRQPRPHLFARQQGPSPPSPGSAHLTALVCACIATGCGEARCGAHRSVNPPTRSSSGLRSIRWSPTKEEAVRRPQLARLGKRETQSAAQLAWGRRGVRVSGRVDPAEHLPASGSLQRTLRKSAS